MLHSTNDDGTLTWYCHTPTCEHHSCSDWHRDLTCVHHPDAGVMYGEPLHVHVSDPGVYWVAHNLIRLPPCPCGRGMDIRVPSEDEAEPARIQRNANGTIQGFQLRDNHPAKTFTIVERSIQKRTPSPEEIARFTNALQQASSHEDLAGMTHAFSQSLYQEIIADVRPHPCIKLHTHAAQLLNAVGKEYKPPEQGV